jgi:hypothetical protein
MTATDMLTVAISLHALLDLDKIRRVFEQEPVRWEKQFRCNQD